MSRRARALRAQVVGESLQRIGLRRRRALADLQKAFEDVDLLVAALAGLLELPTDRVAAAFARRRRRRRP